jgi:hypothetical protein
VSACVRGKGEESAGMPRHIAIRLVSISGYIDTFGCLRGTPYTCPFVWQILTRGPIGPTRQHVKLDLLLLRPALPAWPTRPTLASPYSCFALLALLDLLVLLGLLVLLLLRPARPVGLVGLVGPLGLVGSLGHCSSC